MINTDMSIPYEKKITRFKTYVLVMLFLFTRKKIVKKLGNNRVIVSSNANYS